ncbi:MAG: DoxX family protein [Lysobacterales bacterium]
MYDGYDNLTARLRAAGDWIWPLALRLILGWEFWESGIAKLRGDNWFVDVPLADWQKGFPWPFDLLSPQVNWVGATWVELLCSVLLALGLVTRVAAASLVVVTAVVTAAIHWPARWASLDQLWKGYVITADGAGNYKLSLLFIVMLLPLLFYGGGKFSLDHLLLKLTGRDSCVADRIGDGITAAALFTVLGLTTFFVEPSWGITFFAAALVTGLTPALRR